MVCVKHWDEIEAKVIEVWSAITEWVSGAVDTVKEKFAEMKEAISEKVNAIKSGITEKFASIKNAMADTMQAAKDVVSEKLANMKAAYEEHGGGIKGVAAAAMEGIKGYYSAGYAFIDNLTGGKLTAIKEKFGSILGSARDKVHEIIESIKGLFNFSWSLPKLKLPHFSFSGEFSLNPLSVPKLSVDWYAKGGVLEEPTIFGVNGSTLMGGGEAGKEAVAPIDVLQSYVAEAVASQNMVIVSVLEKILMAIESMDANMGGNMRGAIDGLRVEMSRREVGRIVRAVT